MKGRARVRPAPGRWAGAIAAEVKRRYSRVDGMLDSQLDAGWWEGFDEQAAKMLEPAAARKVLSCHACRRCEQLAFLGRRALEEGRTPTPPCVGLLLGAVGLPCVGVEDLLVSNLDGMETAPVTVGRTLQLVGVQACRRRGRKTHECYCARDVVRFEGDARLSKLMQYGASDWEALGELGLAA